MMYNRYIPQPDGSFKKENLRDGAPGQPQEQPPAPEISAPAAVKDVTPPKPERMEDLTDGDLMALLSMLLIASEGGENRTIALLTLVFYFLL